jgi:CheY-like chemotaxis protein/DNA-directed RNA polymerase subunit RPC12/RpoP
MNCPRCKSAITQSFDPDSIIACPGCGARLMTRAAALRSQGKLKAVDPTPAPPPAASSAGGPASTDPATETPASPVDAFPLGGGAGDPASPATIPPTRLAPPAGSEDPPPGSVSMETLLREIRLLRVTQDEILELLQGNGNVGGARARGPAPEPSSALQPVRSRRRKAVLLIDDDPETCTAARTELEGADVPVRVATVGNDALRLMAEEKPDVIALELGLEGEMAGKDMINLIKATMEWVDIPIILWTREAVATQKEARLVHGADEVVPKSSGPAALVTRVITVFRKA